MIQLGLLLIILSCIIEKKGVEYLFLVLRWIYDGEKIQDKVKNLSTQFINHGWGYKTVSLYQVAISTL